MFAAKNVMLAGAKKAPVVFKDFASAPTASSISLPSHAVGDIIVIFAFGPWGSTNKPNPGGTVPNWTTIRTDNWGFLAYHVATATNHTSGTWVNTYGMQAVVLSGQGASPIGANQIYSYSYTSGDMYVPDLSTAQTDGSSQLLFFATITNYTFMTAFSAAGYTARTGGEANARQRLLTKNDTTSPNSSLVIGFLWPNPDSIGIASLEIKA